MKKYFNYHKSSKYNLTPVDNSISKQEEESIECLKKCFSKELEEIKNSGKCYGDMVRMILKSGITTNITYARELLR
jgi:hypothetical protein